MSAIVVYIDQLDAPGKLSTTVSQLLTLARGAGEPVAVVAGPVSASVLAELGAQGVTRVLNSEQAELGSSSLPPRLTCSRSRQPPCLPAPCWLKTVPLERKSPPVLASA